MLDTAVKVNVPTLHRGTPKVHDPKCKEMNMVLNKRGAIIILASILEALQPQGIDLEDGDQDDAVDLDDDVGVGVSDGHGRDCDREGGGGSCRGSCDGSAGAAATTEKIHAVP